MLKNSLFLDFKIKKLEARECEMLRKEFPCYIDHIMDPIFHVNGNK